ncbi:MAG: DUF2892 domain-containing protein [Ignavibacteria bacterium]|nr:DUF2892 domain-containing protein [Ignavibacteria bacterium]
MKKNMGKTDSILRAIIGILLLIFTLIDPSKYWWGLFGIIPLITSFVRFCPLYVPFKISTNKDEN